MGLSSHFLTLFPVQNFQHNFFQFLLGLTNASCPRETEKKMLIQNFGGITKSIMVFWENRTDFGEGRRDRGHPFQCLNFYYFNTILRKIKSIYVAGWKVSRPPLSEFSGSAPERLSSFTRWRLWPECLDKIKKFSSLCQS